ncbi:MAG TPA: Nif3-like dinuclear metal center hexameric protein [Solirubrobacterales bacterium]|nr:Nif3-like dinuclear metal center hexameric protein [Solirubrobacterales bacterium]
MAATAERDEIIAFCDDLLEVEAFTDYGPNGLQVPGATQVTKVATGVSAHLDLLRRAVDAGAEMLLTHHGLFWDFHPRSLSEQMAARLRVALAAELSVAGYHLPLDAHREIGNNALLVSELGFTLEPTPFGEAKGHAIGAIGRSEEPVAAPALIAQVERTTGRVPLVFEAGPERVSRIAVVTGAGAGSVHEAVAAGVDALITGEPAEHAMADAREGGIHFIAAGHYATETFGIARLGQLVAERFGVAHEFIDVPNPI